MAMIPRIQRDGVRRTLLPVPQLPGSVPEGTFGEDVGAGLFKAGSAFREEEDRGKEQADDIAIMKGLSVVRRRRVEMTDAPEKGLRYLKGDDFDRRAAEAADEYSRLIEEQLSLLTPDQQPRFIAHAQAESDALSDMVTVFEGREWDRRDTQELDDGVAVAIDSVASFAAGGGIFAKPAAAAAAAAKGPPGEGALEGPISPEAEASVQGEQPAAGAAAPLGAPPALSFDDEKVERQVDFLRLANSDYAARHGMGAEWLAAKNHRDVGSARVAIVEQLTAQGDWDLARAYFAKYSEDFDAPNRARITEAFRVREESETVTSSAAEVYDEFSGMEFDTEAERERAARAEARRRVRQSGDPALEDRIDAQLRSRFAADDELREQARRELGRNAYQRVVAGEDVELVRSDPRSRWDELSPDVQAGLLKTGAERVTAAFKAKHEANHGAFLKRLADPRTSVVAMREDRLAALATGEITQEEFDQEEKLQKARLAGGPEFRGVLTTKEIVDGYSAHLFGALPDDSTQEKARKADAQNEYFANVDRLVRLKAKELGRDLTPEEIDPIAGGLASKMVLDGVREDDDMPLRFSAETAGIPLAESIRIRAQLAETGVPITDEAVAGIWAAKLEEEGRPAQQAEVARQRAAASAADQRQADFEVAQLHAIVDALRTFSTHEKDSFIFPELAAAGLYVPNPELNYNQMLDPAKLSPKDRRRALQHLVGMFGNRTKVREALESLEGAAAPAEEEQASPWPRLGFMLRHGRPPP